MSTRSIVPFGPQHPVLPEPIHLDLVLEDEKVVEAVPSIGFVHRGLEKLVEKKEFTEYVYVAERICGICSFMHGMGYCEAVEHIMNIEIPPRARYLRTIWCEMSRIHSHLLWLGLLADAFGFESLFMQSWRIREKVLDMFEASTGGRVIFSEKNRRPEKGHGCFHAPSVCGKFSGHGKGIKGADKDLPERFCGEQQTQGCGLFDEAAGP